MRILLLGVSALFVATAGMVGCGASDLTGDNGSGGTANDAGDGADDAASGGGLGTGGTPIDVGPGSYALPPPEQCKNQYWVAGCEEGKADSACGGVCTSANACQNEGKPGEPGFVCPRFMLFADEMTQASTDDSTRYGWGADSPFEYAVVGHDTDTEAGSVDDAGKSPCCQCYQLVPVLPENQVRDQQSQASAVPLPKPLIVQAFNTGATTKTFDIFMGAGGLGAFNACAPGGSGIDSQYTAYPSAGQPSDGGVKAVGNWASGSACKDQNNLVTAATVDSAGCQSFIAGACNEITSATPAITDATRRSCIEGNRSASLYHQNWTVYAKRIACPQALTEVTGCKLVEDLPAADPNVTTPAQAAADPSFKAGYSTTTMQDCCKPSCSWQDKVTGTEGNHVADGLYNSFYTCSKDGTPLTEPE
ncbi:MAG TPA: hypothetical protein VLC09_14245 [Polyangiaceae bacterium]|nr:hypothetical protein [Polyangiaceae bacterium]